MAYIKERGNNNYFVRVSCGILDNGRPFQKSRLFRPSRVNLPESKVRKELDAFVKALEEECRIEFETKRQSQTDLELSEGKTKQEPAEEQVKGDHQSMIAPINASSAPLFTDFCTIYLAAKKENISSTTYLLYETAIQRNHTQYHTNTGKSRKQTDNKQILRFRGFESYRRRNGVVL